MILHKPILLVITLLTSIGLAMLYSAGNGSIYPWVVKQATHFGIGLCALVAAAYTPPKYWLRHAYTFYFVTLVLLILVEVMGYVGMGAQRWLHIGSFNLQPSELMRISVVLMLARFFHHNHYPHWRACIPIFLGILVPIALVLRQPDLGTAFLLSATALTIFYLSGLSNKAIAIGGVTLAASAPILWYNLYTYQQKRILVFLNPELDPLKAGYHVTQSKIAFGSGGLMGKGFLSGPQSHLHFLPEKQTDFIFTMFGEEFGFVGVVLLIALYALLILFNTSLALHARTTFGRLAIFGFNTTLFLYIFVNTAMVTGLVPVVGIPLPYMSYGGTAMVALLLSQGIMMSCARHQRKN